MGIGGELKSPAALKDQIKIPGLLFVILSAAQDLVLRLVMRFFGRLRLPQNDREELGGH
jgi:hypothetical protein